MPVFIDASLLYAYANKDDINHRKAVKIMEDIVVSKKYGKPIISDYIFDEAVTVAFRKSGKQTAINLGEFIIKSEFVLVKVEEMVFQQAWKLFQETNNFSFTDCTIAAMMKIFGVEYLATFDKEFKNIEGLSVVDG